MYIGAYNLCSLTLNRIYCAVFCFPGSYRFHYLSGRRRHSSLRFSTVPTIGAARNGIPSRLPGVPHPF